MEETKVQNRIKMIQGKTVNRLEKNKEMQDLFKVMTGVSYKEPYDKASVITLVDSEPETHTDRLTMIALEKSGILDKLNKKNYEG